MSRFALHHYIGTCGKAAFAPVPRLPTQHFIAVSGGTCGKAAFAPVPRLPATWAGYIIACMVTKRHLWKGSTCTCSKAAGLRLSFAFISSGIKLHLWEGCIAQYMIGNMTEFLSCLFSRIAPVLRLLKLEPASLSGAPVGRMLSHLSQGCQPEATIRELSCSGSRAQVQASGRLGAENFGAGSRSGVFPERVISCSPNGRPPTTTPGNPHEARVAGGRVRGGVLVSPGGGILMSYVVWIGPVGSGRWEWQCCARFDRQHRSEFPAKM